MPQTKVYTIQQLGKVLRQYLIVPFFSTHTHN